MGVLKCVCKNQETYLKNGREKNGKEERGKEETEIERREEAKEDRKEKIQLGSNPPPAPRARSAPRN